MTIEQMFTEAKLEQLLPRYECTRGLRMRFRGKATTLYREVTLEPGQPPGIDDRIRFTQVGRERYTLSVLLHTGRWERTPFVGSLDELVDVIASTMPHLVAPWPA